MPGDWAARPPESAEILAPTPRWRVLEPAETTLHPANAIASLRVHIVTAKEMHVFFMGTGWLVAPQLLVTAAHVTDIGPLWQRVPGAQRWHVEAVPGVSRGTRPLGSVWATGIVTHPRWDRVSASDFDIAMMRLDTAVLPAADCLTPAVGIQPSTALSPPRIIGYPYIEVHGDTPVEGQGAIRAVESNRLFYDIDTEGGQSGAPILVPATSGRSVVLGLHCGGLGNGASALANSCNAGIHLRKELIDWMGTSGT